MQATEAPISEPHRRLLASYSEHSWRRAKRVTNEVSTTVGNMIKEK